MLCCVPADAQLSEFTYTRYDLEQGLSNNGVLCILRDHQGFMWIGTRNGLNRFDGYTFIVFDHNPNDSTSLSHSWITALHEDRSGALWVGTRGGGLNRFDRASETFVRYKNNPNDPLSIAANRVNAICEDSRGGFWIGTPKGLERFDRSSRAFVHVRIDTAGSAAAGSIGISSIIEDTKGVLWIGSESGLQTFDPLTGKHIRYRAEKKNSLSSNSVTSLLEDHSGRIWIGTQNGLNIFDGRTNTFTVYKHSPSHAGSIISNYVSALWHDRDSVIWIGTWGNGVERVSRQQQERIGEDIVFSHMKNDPAAAQSIGNDYVTAFSDDGSGGIWIGTWEKELNRLHRPEEHFNYFTHDPDRNSVSAETMRGFFQDKDGILWIATRGGGLNRFDRAAGQFTSFRHDPHDPFSISQDSVASIVEDNNGILWIGTEHGLNAFNKKTKRFTRYLHDAKNKKSLGVNYMRVLFIDSKNILWIGTVGGGLDKFQNGVFTHYRRDANDPNSISHNTVTSLFEDNQGRFWVGTLGGGLNLFDRTLGTFQRFLFSERDLHSISSNDIMGISQDSRGTIWIATRSGLNKLVGADEDIRFDRFVKEDGLPNNWTYGILEDRKRFLWIPTDRGLSRLDPAAGTFRNYVMSDGLKHLAFAPGSYHRTANGEMILGGPRGFHIFTPRSPVVSEPRTILTKISVFNLPLVLDTSISEKTKVALRYDQNFISIDFVTLEYTNAAKIQYYYILDGLEQKWTFSGTKREARYTNLDPGEYTFRVRTSLSAVNEYSASVNFIIAPPFWMTWWFRSLLLLGFLSVGPSIYYVRVSQLKKEKKLQQMISRKFVENQEAERSRIAQELHDGLGQELLLIKNSALLSMMKNTRDKTIHSRFEHISDLTSKVIKIARDISYNLRPVELDRIGLSETLRSIVADLRQSTALTVNSSIATIDGLIAKELEINIVRILQEAIHNVLKHSKATEFTVTAAVYADDITITIRDNGVGYSTTASSYKNGLGLAGIQERVQMCDGTIKVISEINNGTSIIIHLPARMESVRTV